MDAQILALGAQFLSYMTEKYKQKLQITVVTVKVCGNHAAIDHFAKMIAWMSVDQKGQFKLNHFNLDINKPITQHQAQQQMQSTNL